MTTPGRRIAALLSLLALLLAQAGSASVLCTCETPCAMGGAAESPAPESAACCAEPAPVPVASLEGECCMADGPSVEVTSVVAVATAPATELSAAAVELAPSPRAHTSPDPDPGSAGARELRTSPPAPPPLFLLTSSFLY